MGGFAPHILSPTAGPSSGRLFRPPMGFFDDFQSIEAATSSTAYATKWLVSGTNAVVPVSVSDEGNGVAALTTPTGDNDQLTMQTWNPFITVGADYDILFESRLKITGTNPLIDIGWICGLMTKEADPFGGVGDLICFGSGDGTNGPDDAQTADIYCYTGDDTGDSWATANVTDTDSGVNWVDDTYLLLRFELTNRNKVKFWINNALVATHTTEIPDEGALLCPTLGVMNGAAESKSLQVDYIGVYQTRAND